MKGGYQLIDFGDTRFTSGTPKTVAGSAKAIIGARGKLPILSNLNVGTKSYGAIPFPTEIIDPTVLQSSVATTIASGSVGIGSDTVSVVFKNNDSVTVTVS